MHKLLHYHTCGHTPSLLVHGMHGNYVITTPLHDTEEDSTEAESSNRTVEGEKLPFQMTEMMVEVFPHFTWLLINSLDRDIKHLQCCTTSLIACALLPYHLQRECSRSVLNGLH